MIFDTHTHLNDKKFCDYDIATLLKGVDGVIVASCDIDSNYTGLELANKYPNIFTTLGIHPHDSKTYNDGIERFLINNYNNPKVVAIGEIGLDYYYNFSDKETQKKIFIRQLQLANQFKLPVVFHIRDAMGDFIEILNNNKNLLNNGGVVHSYSGSVETAKELIKLGMYLSFNGIITFKNSKKAVEVIKEIPLNNILIETDCPYLTPEPYRGQINLPMYVVKVAEKIAEIKNISKEEVLNVTYQNAQKVFVKLGERK